MTTTSVVTQKSLDHSRERESGSSCYGNAPAGLPTCFDFNFDFDFEWDECEGMARFDPEKMAVYRLARQHSRAVRALLRMADTRGFADLVGQLRSSSTSIPANLLEAAGEWRPGKRLHYLMIAKGSTWESWAHTDSMVDFGLVRESAITEVRALQGQITALLITTIRNLETERTRKRGIAVRSPRSP
jgi:four helix bundle protein